MEQTNQTMEATWGITLKIWWWITWRSILSAFAGGFVIGCIVGFILAIAGIDSATIQTVSALSALFGGILGIIINVFFTKKIIGKKFKDFTLVLLKTKKSE